MNTVAYNVKNCPMVEVLEQAESRWVKTLRLDCFWRQQEALPPPQPQSRAWQDARHISTMSIRLAAERLTDICDFVLNRQLLHRGCAVKEVDIFRASRSVITLAAIISWKSAAYTGGHCKQAR